MAIFNQTYEMGKQSLTLFIISDGLTQSFISRVKRLPVGQLLMISDTEQLG